MPARQPDGRVCRREATPWPRTRSGGPRPSPPCCTRTSGVGRVEPDDVHALILGGLLRSKSEDGQSSASYQVPSVCTPAGERVRDHCACWVRHNMRPEAPLQVSCRKASAKFPDLPDACMTSAGVGEDAAHRAALGDNADAVVVVCTRLVGWARLSLNGQSGQGEEVWRGWRIGDHTWREHPYPHPHLYWGELPRRCSKQTTFAEVFSHQTFLDCLLQRRAQLTGRLA